MIIPNVFCYNDKIQCFFLHALHSDEVISRLTASQLEKLLPELSSGMVPKMEGCLHAVRNGVTTARVIDGRVQHSILLEIFTDEGIGTMVVPDAVTEGDAG